MNDLTDALNVFATEPEYRRKAYAPIVDAARKYANLHESIDLDRLEEGLRFAHITDSDGEYLIHVAREVADALEIEEAGITEDTG